MQQKDLSFFNFLESFQAHKAPYKLNIELMQDQVQLLALYLIDHYMSQNTNFNFEEFSFEDTYKSLNFMAVSQNKAADKKRINNDYLNDFVSFFVNDEDLQSENKIDYNKATKKLNEYSNKNSVQTLVNFARKKCKQHTQKNPETFIAKSLNDDTTDFEYIKLANSIDNLQVNDDIKEAILSLCPTLSARPKAYNCDINTLKELLFSQEGHPITIAVNKDCHHFLVSIKRNEARFTINVYNSIKDGTHHEEFVEFIKIELKNAFKQQIEFTVNLHNDKNLEIEQNCGLATAMFIAKTHLEHKNQINAVDKINNDIKRLDGNDEDKKKFFTPMGKALWGAIKNVEAHIKLGGTLDNIKQFFAFKNFKENVKITKSANRKYGLGLMISQDQSQMLALHLINHYQQNAKSILNAKTNDPSYKFHFKNEDKSSLATLKDEANLIKIYDEVKILPVALNNNRQLNVTNLQIFEAFNTCCRENKQIAENFTEDQTKAMNAIVTFATKVCNDFKNNASNDDKEKSLYQDLDKGFGKSSDIKKINYALRVLNYKNNLKVDDNIKKNILTLLPNAVEIAKGEVYAYPRKELKCLLDKDSQETIMLPYSNGGHHVLVAVTRQKDTFNIDIYNSMNGSTGQLFVTDELKPKLIEWYGEKIEIVENFKKGRNLQLSMNCGLCTAMFMAEAYFAKDKDSDAYMAINADISKLHNEKLSKSSFFGNMGTEHWDTLPLASYLQVPNDNNGNNNKGHGDKDNNDNKNNEDKKRLNNTPKVFQDKGLISLTFFVCTTIAFIYIAAKYYNLAINAEKLVENATKAELTR